MEPSIISYNKGQLSSLRPVLDNGIVYTVGRCGKSILKLMGIHLMPVLASQSTFNFAKLDTLFSSVTNTVNQRPIAIESFTGEDTRAIIPNDLLLQRSKSTVPGVVYGTNYSIPRQQEVFRELEQAWWDRWIVQALPHLVPFKEWKHEHRSMVMGDVAFVLFEETVTVDMKKTDKYSPGPWWRSSRASRGTPSSVQLRSRWSVTTGGGVQK